MEPITITFPICLDLPGVIRIYYTCTRTGTVRLDTPEPLNWRDLRAAQRLNLAQRHNLRNNLAQP